MNTQTSFDQLSSELQAIVKRKKLTDAIGSVYLSEHAKPTWTPFELCEEMLDGVDLKGDVLVLSDLGFVPALKKLGANFSRVTVVVHTTAQEELATKFKVGKVWNVGYNDPIKELERELKGMKFDVVVGNPPYQSSKKEDDSSQGTASPLWPKFTYAADSVLKDDGILAFVIPQTWAGYSLDPKGTLKGAAGLRQKIFSQGELFVDFTVDKFFSVGSTFSAVILLKGRTPKCSLKNSDAACFEVAHDAEWLPIFGGRLVASILNKVFWANHEKLQLLNDGKEYTGFRHWSGNDAISPVQSETHPYRVANTSAQYGAGKWLYSSKRPDYLGAPKIIFSDSGYAKPFFDAEGSIVLGHHGKAFLVSSKEEADQIMAIANSKLVRFGAKSMLSSSAASDLSLVMHYLPKVPCKTEEELYEYFHLTPEEISLVESC